MATVELTGVGESVGLVNTPTSISTDTSNDTSASAMVQEEVLPHATFERIHQMCKESDALARTEPRNALTIATDADNLLTDVEMMRPELAQTQSFLLARNATRWAMAKAHERQSEYPIAIRLGRESLEFAENAIDLATNREELRQARLAYAFSCNILGTCYDRTSDFVASIAYRRLNLEIQSEYGSSKDRAHCLMELANAYYRLADYPETLSAFQEALELMQEVGNKKGVGSAWNGIANVQYSQQQYAEAGESYRKGLAAFEELGDPYWEAGLLGNLAGVHNQLGEYAQARDCCLRSLVLRARIGDKHGQAFCHQVLAQTFGKMGDFSKAKQYAMRSLTFFEEIQDRTGMAYAASVLGKTCVSLGEVQVGLRHMLNALQTAEDIGLREVVYQSCEEISETYEQIGDFANALKYFKRFHTVREALFNDENSKRLQSLRAQFDTEQAKRETQLYREYNQELELANHRQAELLEQLQKQSAILEQQAQTDVLTGLLNRRHFEATFIQSFATAQATNTPLAVALLDLDHFKEINDRFSHGVGDAVLRTVAKIFEQHCRKKDVVARYGGEEFIFLFPQCREEEAVQICERIRTAVEQYPWSNLHPDLIVTISGGICSTVEVPHPEKMLSLADTQLYRAKAEGRNRISTCR
jgi:diguanylate cyclase (GGDEF)-like protein